MARILLFGATAISPIAAVTTADAQSRLRQTQLSTSLGVEYAQAGERRPGSPWAMPNECYIDKGFGRFPPCR